MVVANIVYCLDCVVLFYFVRQGLMNSGLELHFLLLSFLNAGITVIYH